MNRNGIGFLVGTMLWLVSCADEAVTPALGPDEKALVDTYVRVTILQALNENTPDSTQAELQHLAAEVDSMALRRALDNLATDPMKWELVYDAIASRLEELESTPALWWSVVRGDTLPGAIPDSTAEAAPVGLPTSSELAPDH